MKLAEIRIPDWDRVVTAHRSDERFYKSDADEKYVHAFIKRTVMLLQQALANENLFMNVTKIVNVNSTYGKFDLRPPDKEIFDPKLVGKRVDFHIGPHRFELLINIDSSSLGHMVLMGVVNSNVSRLVDTKTIHIVHPSMNDMTQLEKIAHTLIMTCKGQT